MARIPLVRLDGTGETRARGAARLLIRAGRRQVGLEADPLAAGAHHPGVMWRLLVSGIANVRRRSVLPDGLADLVTFVTAVDIGCSWCVDFGASLWERKGLDGQTLREAVQWRTSDRFSDDEKAAFGYAEAVTAQPPRVDDAMVADLRAPVRRRRGGGADLPGRDGEHGLPVQPRARPEQPGVQLRGRLRAGSVDDVRRRYRDGGSGSRLSLSGAATP